MFFPKNASFLIVLIAGCTSAIQASLLAQPTIKWSFQIDGSGYLGGRAFRKGNSITYHDETRTIFATADDGTLHIFKPTVAFLFKPPLISPFASIEGRSGVVISPAGFAVYAVIYSPFETTVVNADGSTTSTGGETVSNVLAVNPEDNTLMWSVTVQGYIVGTPVMGADGTKFYVSHNVMNQNGAIQGFVTVMSGYGVVLGSQLTSANGPYGPLAITTDPEGKDMVMWATSNGDGFEPTGQIHVLVQDESGSFQVQAFTNRAISSVTRLALSDRGVWIGGFESVLSAWTMNGTTTRDETYPAWNIKAQPTERNVSQPFLIAPIFSEKGHLYVAGTSFGFFCFDAWTGETVWADLIGRSTYMAEPQVSETTSVVYVVDALTGNVRQHDAFTGTRNWEFDCSDVSGVANCQDSVEADFSISKSGNVVYYGDIFGKIVALEVAAYATVSPTALVMESSAPIATTSSAPIVATASPTLTPTAAPTNSPTAATALPTRAATPLPTTAPSNEPNIFAIAPVVDSSPPPVSASIIGSANQQVDGGSSGDHQKNSFIMISVIAAVVALMMGFVGLFAMQRRRRKNRGTDRSLHAPPDRLARETDVEVSFEAHATFLKQHQETIVGKVETQKQRSPSRVSKPKQKKSPSRIPASPLTPSTLTSIVEAEGEEDRMSDVGPSGSEIVKAARISTDTNEVVHFSSPGPTITLNESIDEECSALDSVLDAISPTLRLEDDTSSLDDLFNAISPDETEKVVCDVEHDQTRDQKDGDQPNDQKVFPDFVPSSLTSVFDRAVVSPIHPPLPMDNNDNDDVSNATDNSVPSENDDCSNNDSSNNDRSGDDEDEEEEEDDEDADNADYLPTLEYLFGGSVPQPHIVDDEKKTADDAKLSHDDWSIDSASVYINERSKKGSVIGDRVATPQPPENDSSLWQSLERALGFAPDSPPRPSWKSIDETGSFSLDDVPDDESKLRTDTLP